MASLPNSAMMARKRVAISSSASSHEIRCQVAPASGAGVGTDAFVRPASEASPAASRVGTAAPSASSGQAPGCPGAKLRVCVARALLPALAAPAANPFAASLRIGYNTRSGEYTRSKYFATLAHKNPRVIG